MPETLAAQAEPGFYPQEPDQPHLRLVASDGVLLENVTTAETETIHSPTRYLGKLAREALEAEYDGITEMAELVDGQMLSEIELTSVKTASGYDLLGPDGRSVTQAAENGLKKAREQAKENPNLWFEVGRRSTEVDEIHEAIQKITSGETNTMVVTTDLPKALENATEDIGGYNLTRKLALARVLTVGTDGKIMMYSQTLDGSNRQALEAIHAELGFQAESGELLGQRRFMTLTSEEQSTLMDRITETYDNEMAAQFGGEWYAGRTPADYRNTFDFVRQQHDLIETYKEAKLDGSMNDQFMYNLAAAVNARFKKYRQDDSAPAQQRNVISIRPDYDQAAVQQEMSREGRIARSQGRTFSSCGSTFKASGADDSIEARLQAAGYGPEGSRSWHGGKKYKNARCVSCKEVKREVGACHICENCVKHPKSNLRTVQGRTGDSKKAPTRDKPADVISLDKYRKAKQEKQNKKARAETKTL